MSMQDTIADLLTHIRNGQSASKKTVKLPSSKTKVAIVKVLEQEGFVESYNVLEDMPKKPMLEVVLKYFNGKPAIKKIDRVSRPGLRVYRQSSELPKVLGGLGIAVVSTSRGVVSDSEARKIGQGGEILCVVE